MDNQEILVTKDGFKSHQTDLETGKLFVDLKVGDTVIIEDGTAYFKRKIKLNQMGDDTTEESLNLFVSSLKSYLVLG